MKGEKLKKVDSGPKILIRLIKKGKFFPNKMQSFTRALTSILDNAIFSVEVIGNGFLFFIQDLSDLRKIVMNYSQISKSIYNKGNIELDFSKWIFQIERNATPLSDSQILELIEKEFMANGNPLFPIKKTKKGIEISFPSDGYEKFVESIEDFKKNLDKE